ncbi:Chromate resistance protein ChrB [Streptosporangium sp. NPDC050855]|uniref:Chromate resistance protein ChrB n=1 Tax=Streptosporangium sp. NPDC050855 TaxID=3366194 RepID=UPI0037B21BED
MNHDPSAPPGHAGQWVLLAYRIPSLPSAPRIAVWRRLERLGVARLGDGLVALPADARTREQLDWIAEEIVAADGTATVWLATPASPSQERAIATQMQQARREEYRAVIAAARAAEGARGGERSRVAGRLRAELRRIGRRDFFPPAERDPAHQAVRALNAPGPASGPDLAESAEAHEADGPAAREVTEAAGGPVDGARGAGKTAAHRGGTR